MRYIFAARSLVAFALVRRTASFAPKQAYFLSRLSSVSTPSPAFHTDTKRFMSSGDPLQVVQLDKAGLNEILEDIENSSREESGYVVIDVRNEDEIAYTGKLSDCVETLPLPVIGQMGALTMSEEDFEASFGFAKPRLDETIVFTCKSGVRSMHAAQFAAMSGYTNIVNYTGGANEWFR